MNRKAAERAPKYDPKADDWDTIVREENTGRCARCDQMLPSARRRGVNGLDVDRFGFRVISL